MDLDSADAEAGADTRAEPRRLHHITRIDIEPSPEHPRRHPTHGWQVRARRDGERQSKFFADARHDGSEGALTEAIAFRDRLLASIPSAPTKPRRAWSNTGVVGLSVREKHAGTDRAKLSIQLNWVDAKGVRKSSSFSVDKWGFRRALWNGCLKLYRERQAAGMPVDEPHEMFARAQEPFPDLVQADIDAEQAQPPDEQPEAEAPTPAPTPDSPQALALEDQRARQLEEVLFG